MRNVFYSVINDTVFKEKYMEAYHTHAEHVESGLSIICGLSSAFSVFAWTRWEDLHLLWSVILLISQVAQIFKSYLPYSRRLNALKHLIPEMQNLVIDAEQAWYAFEDRENPDYTTAVNEFRKRLVDLDIKYLGADPLPDIPRLRSKVEKIVKNHFSLYIDMMGGGDEDAEASDKETHPDTE